MRRRISLTVGLLATAYFSGAAWAQDNEAEKLFRDAEKKLKDAKAVQVVFTYELQAKAAKGSLILTNDNKVRLQVSGQFYFGVKDDASFELVSDGKQLKTKGAKLVVASNGQAGFDLDGHTEAKTPKGFHAQLGVMFSRGGIGPTVLALPYLVGGDGGDIDPDQPESRMSVHDFKAGAAEKVGERHAKVIHYRYGKGGNDDAAMTLWLDSQTGLPLKRVLAITKGEQIRITENYSEIKLNPRLDAKTFELPQ
jgi:outer membrane lipoprotein-sorting protein